MKLSKKRLDDIEFKRVHRIPTRVHEEKINQHPRPIIAKVSFFKDKQQIKSHIKHLPKGKRFGVADDFPKEVDEIRKELYPVLKQSSIGVGGTRTTLKSLGRGKVKILR